MGAPFFLVDAFVTDLPFSGNPAAVCLLDAPAEEGWMQSLGMEMNQAETAFLWPIEGGWSLRWFTPAVEVDLCGHATLASAHVLFETGRLGGDDVARFYTKSGWLTCGQVGAATELDFPAQPVSSCEAPDGLLAALDVSPLGVYRNRMDYLVELADDAAVRAVSPNMGELARVDARGVMVTACTGGAHDFVSRFFAPACGVPEDHATGSAHCALGPFWSERLGKNALTGFQASPRGAVIDTNVMGDRVALIGRARTVLVGELRSQTTM